MQPIKHVKVKGIIEIKKGLSGRIRVLGFRKQDLFIYDKQEILNEFPPYGYVFAGGIFKTDENPLDTIIEFTAIPVETIHGDEDTMRLDLNQKRNPLDFQVIHINEDIMINSTVMNQPLLKKYVNDPISGFYIIHKEILYGEFKLKGEDVIPSTGREVSQYNTIPRIHFIEKTGKSYLLARPDPKDITAKIECFTKTQLAEWFKDSINTAALQINWHEWKKVIEGLDGSTLQPRFIQVRNYMSDMQLTRSEIISLASTSEPFLNLYQQAINNISAEIRKEYLGPIIEEKNKINKEIIAITESIHALKKQQIELQHKNQDIETNNEYLLKEKGRLMKDMQIYAQLLLPSERPDLNTFEIQNYKKKSLPIKGIKEYIEQQSVLVVEDNLDKKKCMHLFPTMKDYNSILCKNIELVIEIARFSNNCILYIQQVEADWLKFNCFYKNGLQQCWEAAINDPDTIYFLLLEDINMASIECYGKPILDIIAGRRNSIPGFADGWPKNLWLFGIPLETGEESSFGLPLISSTFKYWGTFPAFKTCPRFINKDGLSISLKTIQEQEGIAPNYHNEYFSI